MNQHLKMVYKAVKVVIAFVLAVYLLFFCFLCIAKFAQWRVDVNVAREEMMEIRNRSMTDD